MPKLAALIYANGPATDPLEPDKADLRDWGTWVESLINAFTSNGGLLYTSRAALYSDLAPPAPRSAWVMGDPVAEYNGIYVKIGVAGSGSWTRVGDLPFSYIVASDDGSGNPNAIQASSSVPISESALIWVNGLAETTTGSPVTISFNGGSNLTVKTIVGNDPSPGSLLEDMVILGVKIGSTFRLLSDQASSAIVAAAEAAAVRAENAAALALNNFLSTDFVGDGISTDFLLPSDPGSTSNMLVNIEGAFQLSDAFSLVYSGGNAYLRLVEVIPLGARGNVRFGNVITVGTPTDGSITTPKLANASTTTAKLVDKNVTYAKMQDISATARLLGRKSSGAGSPEELTAADLRDLFLPVGSVVDSTTAVNSAGTPAVTTTIPLDNTIPQITEGTQVLQVQITPKSITNKLRIRVSGMWSNSAGPATNVWAIFNGNANAIRAAAGYVPLTDALVPFSGEVEYVPGATTLQTISLRLGRAGGSGTVLFDAVSANLVFGGVAAIVLTVEEIKA